MNGFLKQVTGPAGQGSNREKLRKHKEILVVFLVCLMFLLFFLRFFNAVPWICVREGSPQIPSKCPSYPPNTLPKPPQTTPSTLQNTLALSAAGGGVQ